LRGHAFSDERLDTVARLDAFSAERGHTLLDPAMSWLIAQPVVASVIAGATRPEQVVSNAAAATWDLTADDLDRVSAILAS
jgi:aryl-alcohol dehydrogenase-like predicted oxidoreductase